jgi:hypothetical protein
MAEESLSGEGAMLKMAYSIERKIDGGGTSCTSPWGVIDKRELNMTHSELIWAFGQLNKSNQYTCMFLFRVAVKMGDLYEGWLR